MTFNRKKLIFLLAGIFLCLSFFILVQSIFAATSTIKGKAYWGQYDYIYFNCSDDVIGNRFDESENLAGGNIYVDPPAEEAFHFYSEPCTDLVHGVYIDEDGVVSGDAWNPNFGLISFEHNGIDPPGGFGSFNSPCEESCNPSTNCIACYIPEDQMIYGWGRIVTTTIPLEDRWIRFDAYPPDNLSKIYTDDSNPIYPGAYLELGDFAGTASSTWGDISLNCQTENYPGSDTCTTRSYKVYIKNLILSRLSAPNWTYTNACDSGALRAVLRWDRLSGVQTGYEIVVNDTNSFNTTTADYVCWTGEVPGSANQHTIYGYATSDCPSGLSYDTAYYWWLRGYDEDGLPTQWVQYDNNSLTDSDQNRDGLTNTFQTFKHEMPHPFFVWDPEDVLTSTTTTFTSESFVYDNISPNTAKRCADYPGLCTGFLWETTDNDALISATTSSSTDIIFYSATNTTVTLFVTDFEGYMCSTSTTFRINYDLPLWREVKAE